MSGKPEEFHTVVIIGNIGYTQNLVQVVRAFEDPSELDGLGARTMLAGDGRSGSSFRADDCSSHTTQLATKLAEVLRDRSARRQKGETALRFAREEVTPDHLTSRFRETLARAVAGRNRRAC